MSVFHNGVTYRAADAHAHIYPGKIAEKATGSVGEFYHIPMQNVGLPHILAQRGEEAGIDRFLVCSVATKVEQVRSINQFIQEKCQKYPQFIGLAAWHQDVADIQGEMDDIQRRGLRGIKLHPDFQRFYIDDERMFPVYEEAHRRGLPGYSEWEDARRELSGTNVYIDTSSSLFAVTPEQARKSIDHFGIEHTLFGTDFPMWSPKEELERFFALGYGQEDNRKMLYGNFARLFRLED